MTAGTAAAGAATAAEVLGPERVLVRQRELHRWTVGGRTPSAVAFPRTTEEVAALLERAVRSGVAVAPAGAGTWLQGGDAPGDVGLLVSTRDMDRILHYEPADLTLTGGSGCRLRALDEAMRPHGQWLPLDPRGGGDGTLGATVATASDGSLRTRYGGVRDMVLGLTVVTGGAEILRLGGKVVKNVAGFDLCRLMVGSWGTLGIVTEVTVRLHPRPEARRRLVLTSGAAEDLVGPALEVGDAASGAACVVLEETAAAGDARTATLTVELHGSRRAVQFQAEGLRERAGEPWEEEPIRSRTGSGGRADLVVGLRLPRTELDRLFGLAAGLVRVSAERRVLRAAPVRPGLEADALEGSLRVLVPNVRTDGPWPARWADRMEDLRRTLERRGGGLTLEQAPSEVARRMSSRGAPSGVERELMGRIRSAFDPAGILVPERPPHAEAGP